jgi:hypothetical protein
MISQMILESMPRTSAAYATLPVQVQVDKCATKFSVRKGQISTLYRYLVDLGDACTRTEHKPTKNVTYYVQCDAHGKI